MKCDRCGEEKKYSDINRIVSHTPEADGEHAICDECAASFDDWFFMRERECHMLFNHPKEPFCYCDRCGAQYGSDQCAWVKAESRFFYCENYCFECGAKVVNNLRWTSH